jgi:type IV pilus assembly protein PilC
MALFNYLAINDSGKRVKGKVNAANPVDLENKIKELKYELIDYKVQKARKSRIGRKKIKPKDMIMFCVHMEELDRAGVPILESLIDLRDTVENSKMRDLLSDLVEYIRGGDQLSAAIQKKSEVFGELFYGLVAVGEETGNIGDSHSGIFQSTSNGITDFRRKD